MDIIVIVILLGVVFFSEAVIYRYFGLRGIEYSVKLSKHEAFEGETIEIIEEVSNKKILPVPWLKSEITTSRWLEFSNTRANRAVESRFVPSVFVLKPYCKCTRKWKVKCLKRGTFKLEDTNITSSDIVGLASSSAKIRVDDGIRVLPVPYKNSECILSDKSYFGSVEVRRFIAEDPFLISGTREYTGREPMNKIHWGSTARNSKLMVFNNDFSTENRILVIMNMQKSADGDVRPLHISDLETFIKLTASIADEAYGNGINVDFTTNGTTPDGMFIEGGSGRENVMLLLRALSDIENTCYTSIGDYLDGIKTDGYTDICFITAFVNEAVVSFAANAEQTSRFILLCNDEVNLPVQHVAVGRYSHYNLVDEES